MKIIGHLPGSPEWDAARLGLPTASQVDRIMTPKKLNLSTQSYTYRNQLLAEWLLGYSIDWSGQSGWMDRGTRMEEEARAYYEFKRDAEVRQVGFILREDGRFGGTPDGLVGDDGGVEIKCPALHTHIGYLVDSAALAVEYNGQTQAYMMLADRAWIDLLSYSPQLPPVLVRVERDQRYISALNTVLDAFLDNLEEARTKLAQYKVKLEQVAAA